MLIFDMIGNQIAGTKGTLSSSQVECGTACIKTETCSERTDQQLQLHKQSCVYILILPER